MAAKLTVSDWRQRMSPELFKSGRTFKDMNLNKMWIALVLSASRCARIENITKSGYAGQIGSHLDYSTSVCKSSLSQLSH